MLRDYQKEGYGNILDAWEIDDLVMFVLATGGGKTVTFVELIKRAVLAGRRVMLIAHREELILQAWNTLYAHHIYAGIIMSGYPENWDLKVQVCSIQTIQRRTKLPPADEVYIDEGHHAQPDNTYGKMIKYYTGAKFLLVTATPYRLSGEGFVNLHPYKPTRLIVNRTLKQLQSDGWLVDLKYYAASIPDLSELSVQKGDYVEAEAQKAMELAPLIDSYEEHAQGKSGVVFTVNVAHSVQVCSKYQYAGVPCEHLDGNTPGDQRQRILSDFRAGLVKVISNVGIITEGFDFPDMDFVQLARPTKSLTLYLQMIGRVTRPACLLAADSTREDRLRLITGSRKPFGIVLDNAGCWTDHGLPDFEHNWEYYFRGTKRQKKEDVLDDMEMLVYVAETADGRIVRTHKAKEVEGLKLVEITKEGRRKIVNITSIKEFDRLLAIFKNNRGMRSPGLIAYRQFMEYCKKQNILIVDEIWEYLFRKLYTDPRDQVDQINRNRSINPGAYPMPLYQKSVEEINRVKVGESFLKGERAKYERENQKEVLEARFGSRVPASGQLRL